jgi:hypothetical protein
MMRYGTRIAALGLILLAALGRAETVWEFNGSADPVGAKLERLAGAPVFATVGNRQVLAAESALTWADAPELRLSPEMEFRCSFRLDQTREGTQTLAMKEGEYILRVDWQKEGGNLSFFVQIEGIWEPRLRGPVVQTDTWYDVRAQWTGTTLNLDVNGVSFSSRRAGRIRPTANPLQIGPLAGPIDRLAIRNPGYERSVVLLGLTPAGASGANQSQFGGDAGWQGWQGLNGATCDVRNGVVTASFPSASAMLVSPPLACDVAPLPFVCLDVEAPGPGWVGHLDVASDTGTGSLAFEPLSHGRTTLIAGNASAAWSGTLRRLALSFSGGEGPILLKRLVLADRAVGVPWFYLQDLAPGRAKLRPGREETVIAGIKNLGGEVENTAARLLVPEGIEILGEAVQTIPYLGKDDFDLVTWRLRAARAGAFTVRAEISAAGAETRRQDLGLAFEPLPELERTGYVPVPRPAQTDYLSLMHYCALWKEGTHYGWKQIEPWPGRRPAIGWYDEGTAEVADWHIKYAVEHGVNAFIYCWYRKHFEPKIEHTLGHAIHEGLFEAKYRGLFKFCIMWENGCAVGVKDADDLLDNLLPFWIENYFTHPSYVKVDNQPLLFVWQPRKLIPQLGGPAGTQQAFERMRARCREAGFAGLRLIACMDGPEEALGKEIAASGWDAVTGYGLRPRGVPDAGVDPEGIPYTEHAAVLSRYKETWQQREACTGGVPDIPNVMMGWDPRPWGRNGGYIVNPQAANFEAACREAKALVDAKPAERWDRKLVVFDNWTEFGEGHYVEPTSGQGFTFANTIKRVFCTAWAPEASTDVIPEDLGLAPPQKRYAEVRAGYGSRLPWQPMRVTGDLLAAWQFETEAKGAFLDSSPNDFRLRSVNLRLEPGRGGLVLRCGDGGATCPAPAPFYHPGGISVALWCKPSEAGQSDRWMLNSMAGSQSGYRLGLASGRPAWQIPLESWSHSLIGPEPLPVGEWSHLAATFDNQTMRLYVNGREVGTLPRAGFIAPGRDLVVGAYSPDLDRARFRGWLDEVRLYRRVLSAAELAGLAQSP